MGKHNPPPHALVTMASQTAPTGFRPGMGMALLAFLVVVAAPAAADDVDCSNLDEAILQKMSDACTKCDFKCLDAIEDQLERHGPKVNCNEEKFTEEYKAHEAEECVEALFKKLKEMNPDYPCSMDKVKEVGENEIGELICEKGTFDDPHDDDDDEDDEDEDDMDDE